MVVFWPKLLDIWNEFTGNSFKYAIKSTYTMANFHAAFQLICIRFVFFVSLLEFIYNIIAFVCSNISAIHIQQFCNLMQNICNWKSILQSNYKKIAINHHTNARLQTTTPLPRQPWDSNPWPLGCQPSALSILPRDLLLKSMKIYPY